MTARKTTEPTDATVDGPTDSADAPATEAELNIYQRIAAISREAGALAPESKGGVPFAFRGVDGTVAHLTPFLNKYGVFLSPAGINHIVTEREVGSRVVKTSQVEQKFDVYGPEGYGFTVETAGLADDFADRSTAQAQSVAYRIALLQLFHLPTHTKDPEETGQAVLDGAGEGATAPRGPKAVEAAKATAPATTPVARLQQEAKALGRKLNMEPATLNEKGAELSGGKDVDVWFNDASTMEKIVEWLKGQEAA